MGKHGTTKENILRLISEGKDSLSAISDELGLAPSTVSKHIHDLEVAGLIEQKNRHIMRWKNYRLSPAAFSVPPIAAGRSARRKLMLGVSAIALVLMAVSLYSYLYRGMTYVPISITDPPQVPLGTQVLYINYSSLAVHIAGAIGRNSTIYLNQSGRLDLMGLINESQVIAGASLPDNAEVLSVSFNITSASIVIGNSTHQVEVKGNHLVAVPEGDARINSSSNILLDIFPIVVPYQQNGTSFAMLPALRAIVAPMDGMGRSAVQGIAVSAKFPLDMKYMAWASPAAPNITLSDGTLAVNGTNASFGISIANNAPQNITIYGITIGSALSQIQGASGGVAISVNSDSPRRYVYCVGSSDAGGNRTLCTTAAVEDLNSSAVNINATGIYTVWKSSGANAVSIRLKEPVSNISIFNIGTQPAFGLERPDMGVLIAYRNGTLRSLAPSTMPGISGNAPGYVLAGNAAVGLSYDGDMGLPGAAVKDSAVWHSGANYTVTVLTSMGPARANLTAT